MIWLTWRQFRTPALTTGALLLVLLAGLALTWTQVGDLASAAGFTGCRGDACEAAADTFRQSLQTGWVRQFYNVGMVAMALLPALLGIFWGAPLVARELETGTYRMVFSQSVGRGRWLLVKLALGGAAAALGTGLLSLVLSRWAHQIDLATGDRITPLIFQARGIVPVGYAVLAFVIGVTAGLLLRRTVTAMVVTLLLVAGLQIAMPMLVRPWLAQPVTTITALDTTQRMGMGFDMSTKEMRLEPVLEMRNAWIMKSSVITTTGAEFRGPADTTKCGPDAPNDRLTCPEWLRAQNLRTKLTYVPDAKFWTVQWREFGLLVALGLALSAFSLWWIRRRLI
ncbi:transporter [Actinoplanes ianthinogenes]|uniref:Transporter n=1 Tax=Actinoplanes ianthinogenes TaxID=122358 RepID=A0ABN6CN09_9ACTN|nr:ABC transporter permease subunit [Actinoplanes ianthinogenes]BCJ46526.1 transporter [Actinoplanes ianthinogenes]GGR34839.1 transporter [Actinoplanes ianthinogenes]